MPSDTADVKDVQEANDTIQEAAGATKPLGPAGMKAMQGKDLQAELRKAPINDVPESPEPPAPQGQEPVKDPDSAPRPMIAGERGLAEWVESGPEKPEKEIFTGFRRGIERGG